MVGINFDDWEQRKLGELCQEFQSGKNIKSEDIKENGIYPVYRGNGLRGYSDTYNHDGEYALIGRQGALCGNMNISYGKAYFTEHAIAVEANISNNTKFLFFLFDLMNLGQYSSQSAQPGLAVNKLIKLSAFVPSLREQDQISSLFTCLDETIALHQDKLEKLKKLKKGYLQVMFPQKGEKVPRLRFAHFFSDWEQRKLGELAEIVRGASPRPIQNPKWFDINSDIGWLRISDVTKQNGRIHYLEQKISKAGQEKTRVLLEPHLLLSIAATVGKPVINYVKTGVHDGFLIFLNPSFNKEFIFQWLEMVRPEWQKYGQPGSQVYLNSELVKNQDILLPSLQEQSKISDFFIRLDDSISHHYIKVQKLKNLKKIYLQKIFV